MAKPKIKPIGPNILVKPLAQEEKTESGIVLPDTVDKEKPQRGEVVKVGTGIVDDGKKLQFNVKEGDVVIFKKYSPDEIEVDGEDYLIMTEGDILAIIG